MSPENDTHGTPHRRAFLLGPALLASVVAACVAPRAGLGPVTGFADTHLHQGSEMAFGGGWMWGAHDGKLRACTGFNHATPHARRTEPYRHWPHYADGSHQQAGARELELAWKRGLRLAVVTAENNEILCAATSIHKAHRFPCDDMTSAKLQLRAYHAFAKKHPWYRIARDPSEARRIIHDGHLAVVLAVEVSNLFPKKHGDWRRQLDELYALGVRSFELAHETDSRFAGSAQHHGALLATANWLHRAKQALSAGSLGAVLRKVFGLFRRQRRGGLNTVGLTAEGRELLAEMVRRKMLIPLDHISRRSRADVFEEIASKHAYYPIYATHSRFDTIMHPHEREKVTQEYMLADETVRRIRETGGTFGLRTGSNPMVQVEGCVPIRCWGSSESVAQNVCWADKLGVALTLGTDLSGGPFEMTAPRFPSAAPGVARKDRLPSHCSKNVGLGVALPNTSGPDYPSGADSAAERARGWGFDVRGLAHVGYERDLIEDMRRLGAPVAAVGLANSAERFLRMWERAYDPSRKRLSASEYARFMGLAPTGRTYRPRPAPSYEKRRERRYRRRRRRK